MEVYKYFVDLSACLSIFCGKMTTNKSKKGLVEGKVEMMKMPWEFLYPPPISNYRMPPGISGSDNAPKKPEHLRKKKLVSGVRKKRATIQS